MAQLVARFVRNEKVGGSSPLSSTIVMSRDMCLSCRETSVIFGAICRVVSWVGSFCLG